MSMIVALTSDKYKRVPRFHDAIVKANIEMISSADLQFAEELNSSHIFKRTNQSDINRHDQTFPYISAGALLEAPYPEMYEYLTTESSYEHFLPSSYVARHEKGLKPLD